MKIVLIISIIIALILTGFRFGKEGSEDFTVIFLNAPWTSDTIYNQSNANGLAFLFYVDDPRTDPNWKLTTQEAINFYKERHPDDPIYLSFNAGRSDETRQEMGLNTDFEGLTGIFIDASSTSGKDKKELMKWLLQYNHEARKNGVTFGFYLGDAYHERAVGWTEKDLRHFANQGVRIWVDVYSWGNGNLRGNLITWEYPYIHVHFHLGLPGDGYYSTYGEMKASFDLIKHHKTIEAVQVFPCRIPNWHITYPEWAARAIGEVTKG